jgi:hypothetical protein
MMPQQSGWCNWHPAVTPIVPLKQSGDLKQEMYQEGELHQPLSPLRHPRDHELIMRIINTSMVQLVQFGTIIERST